MKLNQVILLCITCLGLNLFADDGMWLPHQMSDLNLEEEGLMLDPADLYRQDGTGIMSAIVYLGGGTGEFVSDNGLILTNHHVAYRAIQSSSSPANDYLQKGFLAMQPSEEIAAPGYYADVLQSYREVTGEVIGALDPQLTGSEKYQALQRIMNKMAAEVEETGPDIVCKVVPMYSGNMYYLFRFKRLKDIRLVYAPPKDLGNFGGDVDNWMWPRHTCDFSFLRAYVSPDNIGTEFHPENIPYKPGSVLRISLDGLQEDDFTFVMGYPGRTYRNYTTAEYQHDIERMRASIGLRQNIIGFLEAAGAQSEAVRIKYASKLRSLNNGLKNYQAKLEWFDKSLVEKRKQEQEAALRKWIAADPERAEKYAGVLERITRASGELAAFNDRKRALEQLVQRNYGPALLYQAYLIAKNAIEKTRPENERESLFQARNQTILRSRIELADRSYDPETDRRYFIFLTKKMISDDVLPGELADLFSDTSSASISRSVEDLYERTRMGDLKYRLELLAGSPENLASHDDPILQLGYRIARVLDEKREQEQALIQTLDDARQVYRAALLEMRGGRLAPDANGTLRFTYGKVKGYSPRDAVEYLPFTTLRGVIEKDTGVFPFHVPEKLKTLHQEGAFGQYGDPAHDDVVTCFLNTTNVTGGNSGSPTLNAKGEQVGIIFDMTYESVTGDYYVIPELQRTISVDIRYVLFITEKFSGAGHIIRELNLNRDKN